MYTVNGTPFQSFFKAVETAKAIDADVMDDNGLRRWTPAVKKTAKAVHRWYQMPDGSVVDIYNLPKKAVLKKAMKS